MKILHVIIDSNIYYDDRSFNKINFKDFIVLCQINAIQLHIPEMIYLECITKNESEIAKDIKESHKLLSKIEWKGLTTESNEQIKKIIEQIKLVENEIKNSISTNWSEFIKKTNAKVHKIKSNHGLQAIKDYFSGRPPYSNIKNRNDIPDSYIYQAILDILSNEKEIHFISNDGNLAAKLAELKNIYVYKSLDEFLKNVEIQSTLKEYKIIGDLDKYKAIKFLDLVKADSKILNDFITDKFDTLYGIEFQDVNIPDDNNTATIQTIEDIYEIKFNFNEYKIYDKDFLLIPFTVKANACVDYYIFKSDYYIIYDREIHTSDWNDHYYLAEESIPLIIESSILIDINEFENLGNLHNSDIEFGEIEHVIVDFQKFTEYQNNIRMHDKYAKKNKKRYNI